MSNTAIIAWQPAEPTELPDEDEPNQIVQRAIQLSPRDQAAIAHAFQTKSYEMAANYVWSKTAAALKKQLSLLGMAFLGEMLNRTDLDEYSNPILDIRDDEAIELAEQLGMITTTESLRLRNGQNLVNHFLDPEVSQSEQMYAEEAMTILRTCVGNFLAEPRTKIQLSFLELRRKLESETLKENSKEATELSNSPYFYVRTTLTVLLSQLKNSTGAKLEHAAGNVQSLLPKLWPNLRDKDKWQTGETYAIIQANNRPVASAGLRLALLKVQGFDFVPETLRSESFRTVAREVLSAHFAYDNYHNEPKPMATLAKLGSSIPIPALAECFTAALCVYLGNYWGHSHAAQPHVDKLFKLLRPSQWELYFNKFLSSDSRVLEKIAYEDKPFSRWQELLESLELVKINLESRIAKMVTSDPKKKKQVQEVAKVLRSQIMQKA